MPRKKTQSIEKVITNIAATATPKQPKALVSIVRVKPNAVWWGTQSQVGADVQGSKFFLQSWDVATDKAAISTQPLSDAKFTVGYIDMKYLEVI